MNSRFRVFCILLCVLPLASVHAGYSVTTNAAISGHNKKKVSGGLKACKQACDTEQSFLCKSFDYDKRSGSCDLSDKTAKEVGGLKTDYKENPYDYYARTLDNALLDQSKYLRLGCTEKTNLDCSGPQQGPYKKIFLPACEIHDKCYSAPWRISGTSGWKGQRKCDEEFKQNLATICESYTGLKNLECRGAETGYFNAVKEFGTQAFSDGQKKAEQLCGNRKAKGGTLRIFNTAGYVADFMLIYTYPKKIKSGDTYVSLVVPETKIKRLRLGQWYEFNIPEGSTNISMSAKTRTGKVIFSEQWNEPRTECRKVYGTVFKPKWNKVCEVFDGLS